MIQLENHFNLLINKQMREQQLITKQDLYSRDTYTGDACNKQFSKTLDKQYTLHTNA